MNQLANALGRGLYNQVGRFLDPTQADANSKMLQSWWDPNDPSKDLPGAPWQASLFRAVSGRKRYYKVVGGQPQFIESSTPPGAGWQEVTPGMNFAQMYPQGQAGKNSKSASGAHGAGGEGSAQPPSTGMGLPSMFPPGVLQGLGGPNLSQQPQQGNQQNILAMILPALLSAMSNQAARPQIGPMPFGTSSNPAPGVPVMHAGGGPLAQMRQMMQLDRGEVPAILESGEVVINKNAVNAIGADNLDILNRIIPRYHDGSAVDPGQAGMDAYHQTVDNPYFQPDKPGWIQQIAQAIQNNPEIAGAIGGFPMGGPLGSLIGALGGAAGRAGVFQDPVGSVKGALQTAGNALLPEIQGDVRMAQGKPFYNEETQKLMGMGRYLPPDPLMKPFQNAPGTAGPTGKMKDWGGQVYSAMNLQAAGATSENTQWVPADMYDKNKGVYSAFLYDGKPMYFTDRQTGKLVVPTNMFQNKAGQMPVKGQPPAKAGTPAPAPQQAQSGDTVKGAQVTPPHAEGAAPAQAGYQAPGPYQFPPMGQAGAAPQAPAKAPQATPTPIGNAPAIDFQAASKLDSGQLQQYLYDMARGVQQTHDQRMAGPASTVELYGQLLQQATGADISRAQLDLTRASTVRQQLSNSWDSMTADARARLIGTQLDKESIDNSFLRYLYGNKAYLDATLQKPIADYMLVRAQQRRWEAEAYYYMSRAGQPGSLRGDQGAIRTITGLLQGQKASMDLAEKAAQSGKLSGNTAWKQYFTEKLRYQLMLNPQLLYEDPKALAGQMQKAGGIFSGGKQTWLSPDEVKTIQTQTGMNQVYFGLYQRLGGLPPEAMTGGQMSTDQIVRQMQQEQQSQQLDNFGLPQ